MIAKYFGCSALSPDPKRPGKHLDRDQTGSRRDRLSRLLRNISADIADTFDTSDSQVSLMPISCCASHQSPYVDPCRASPNKEDSSMVIRPPVIAIPPAFVGSWARKAPERGREGGRRGWGAEAPETRGRGLG